MCIILSLIAAGKPLSRAFPRMKASIMAVLLIMGNLGVHHKVEDAIILFKYIFSDKSDPEVSWLVGEVIWVQREKW